MDPTERPGHFSAAEIEQRAAVGAAWNYLAYGFGKLLNLATTAILARLLVPAEFGIVALAALAIGYIAVLKDLGLGAALIQRPDHEEDAANTVFTLNLVLGAVLTAITFVAAPLVADYFREPQVTAVLRVLGLSFVLNSVGAIHSIRLLKELHFKRKILPDLGNTIVKGIVAVAMALSGAGVWALVGGQLAGVVSFVTVAWLVRPWVPRLAVDRRLARQLLGFGVPVLGSDSLNTVIDTLDYLVVGRVLGSAALGVYSIAYRIPELLVISLLWVVSSVVFPAFAAMQNRLDEIRELFLKITRYVSMLVMPIGLGLVVAGEPIVRVLFGGQWEDAIPVVRWLGVYVLIRSVGYHVGGIYKAVGRPGVLVVLGLISLAILAPSLVIGVQYGIVGVAVGHVVASVLRTVVRLVAAQRLLDVGWVTVLRELRPAAAAGAALVAATVPVMAATAGLGDLSRLVLVVPAGAIAYLGTLLVVERPLFRHLWTVIRSGARASGSVGV